MKLTMLARSYLKKFLQARIYQGNLDLLPQITRALPNSVSSVPHQGYLIKPIQTEEERTLSTQFMIETFYQSGNIPRSLKLSEAASRCRHSIAHKEIEMCINSGTSLIMKDPKGNLASVALYSLWEIDPHYNSFEVNMVDWLNVGGEIATEFGQCDDEICAIWRYYQYQLIYHLFHHHALSVGDHKTQFLYTGMQQVLKEHRNKRLSMIITDRLLEDLPKNLLVGFMGTFSGFRRKWGEEFKDQMTELAFTPYHDLKLMIRGQNVFNHLNDQEGITVAATKI